MLENIVIMHACVYNCVWAIQYFNYASIGEPHLITCLTYVTVINILTADEKNCRREKKNQIWCQLLEFLSQPPRRMTVPGLSETE